MHQINWKRACGWLVVGLLIAGFVSGCGGGDVDAPQLPPDGWTYAPPPDLADGWTVAHAADRNVDVARLEAMVDALPADYPIVDSIAIAVNGRLILDRTQRTTLDRFDADVGNTNPAMHLLFSATKSLASLAIGIAIERGWVDGVDQPYLSLFPYPAYANPDPRKAAITLEDVLTMRHGIDWDEWDPPFSDPDNAMLRFYAEQTDFAKAFFDRPMGDDPGTVFAYSTPASVTLGQAIENAAPLTLIDVSFSEIFGPLGITDVEVLRTPTGLPDLGRGLYLTTRDFLKFGQLYLDRGTWNGQRLVSEAWIDASLTAHVPLAFAEPERFDWQVDGYGYQWWTGYFEFDGMQLTAYAARGNGQQNLFVVPALGLTVAVFASDYAQDPQFENAVFELVRRYVLAAVAG